MIGFQPAGGNKPTTIPTRGGGRLFIVSAPSGAGKTTLCRAMRARFPQLRYSVSYTTRQQRPGEKDGADYHFISAGEFEEKIKADQWAEWAMVHGNYYGTSAIWLSDQIDNGRSVLLDIDVQGARQIMKRYPDHCVTVFIMPPDRGTLRRRLDARGTDDIETVEKRMKNAIAEMEQRHLYQHVIVNDDLGAATRALAAIISENGPGGTENDPQDHGCP